jgi:outer membrane protein TolC
MIRQLPQIGGLLAGLTLVTLLVGCNPQQPFYLHEDGDLSHWIGHDTEIEYPDVDQCSLDEVTGAMAPATVMNFEDFENTDITLEEAVQTALQNSKVMRSLGGVSFGPSGTIGTPGAVLSNPDGTVTTYNPALNESDPRFGTAAALSAFDTQFTTSMFWEKNDTPQNTTAAVTAFRPSVFQQDLGTFQAQLRKTNATGGTMSLGHNVVYEWNNATASRKWPSDYSTNLQAEFRQPLMQGAGVQYNRIAGPGAIPGFNSGIMIARIRTDIVLAEFEAGVRNLVNDVETAYWNLNFAYRRLDTAIAGRDSTLRAWQVIHAKRIADAEGGTIQSESQARTQYWAFEAIVQQSQSSLFSAENALRYIMGLSPTDGRLFRPSDEPTRAPASFDWHEVLGEGLSRSVELRRQKWQIKQTELELIASKNYLLPRLDAVGRYRWLGLGDTLIEGSNTIDSTGAITNAYGSMTSGDFAEWNIGLELSLPLGFRKEMAGVRHAQLQIARERAILQEQELELSHQLSSALRELDLYHLTTQTNFARVLAAQDEVDGRRAVWVAGVDKQLEGDTINLYLNALQRLAEAQNEYFSSLKEYNLAITNVHYRKGSLLEYNGVYLAEGPWVDKAQFDAMRRARARDASYYLDYGFTRPGVISRGGYQQHANQPSTIFEDGTISGPDGELIPTPDPESMQMPKDPGYKQTGLPAIRIPRLTAASPANPTAPKAKPAGKFDIAQHFDVLGVSATAASKPGKSDLQQVSYEADTDSGNSTVLNFAAPELIPSQPAVKMTNEPVKNPSPAATDRAASGWKKSKR